MNGADGCEPVKVLYVDPSLRSHLGHHANVCSATVGALRERGHHVKIAISRKAAKYLEGNRCLSMVTYKHMQVDPDTASGLKKLRASVAKICRDIIPSIASQNPDIVYAHSIGGVECEALMKAVATVYTIDRRPPIIAELPFPSEPKEDNFYGRQLAVMLKRLKENEPELLKGFTGVTVNADTSRLLASAIDHDIQTMPSPYATSGRRMCRTSDDQEISIGSIGHQSDAKGFHFLPDVIESCRHLARRIRFVIQIQNNSDPQIVSRLRQAILNGAAIDLIEEDLDRAAYEKMLSKLNIVLLPYHPQRYQSAISGICYEGLSQGSVLVAPDYTTVGSIIRQYQPNASLFGEWTHQSISEAVRRAVESFGSLDAEALRGIDLFRQSNGPLAYADAIAARKSSMPNSLSIFGKSPRFAQAAWWWRGLRDAA